MQFLPRVQILTLEELAEIAESFISLGVKKIRLTGGEPLIRHNIMELVERLGANSDLNELVLTTNGTHLEKFAKPLQRAGVKRVNISLDSLHAQQFQAITRVGNLENLLAGINAACEAGFERIKLNSVILKGQNYDEILDLARFAIERDIDLSYIEEMPFGEVVSHDRKLAYCSSAEVLEVLRQEFELVDVAAVKVGPTSKVTGKQSTAGPSRYYQVGGSCSRFGFISPHSHNFCGNCNRVRMTVEGRLLLCLGNEHSVDFKKIIRRYPGNPDVLREAIIKSIGIKPERHWFNHDDKPQISRFMNTTGG